MVVLVAVVLAGALAVVAVVVVVVLVVLNVAGCGRRSVTNPSFKLTLLTRACMSCHAVNVSTKKRGVHFFVKPRPA